MAREDMTGPRGQSGLEACVSPLKGSSQDPGSMMAICEQWVRAGKLDIRLWM